jgi:centrosomal protein CEP76
VALDAALRKHGLYDAAREVLRDYASVALGASPSLPAALPADVFSALRQAGLVDRLLAAAREEGLNFDAATFELLGLPPASPPGSAPPDGGAAAQTPAALAAPPPPAAPPLDPCRRYVRLDFGRGRAFLSHLDASFSGGAGLEEEEEAEAAAGAAPAALTRFYALHVLCNGQRFRSAPIPATVEPDFAPREGGGFVVDVQPPGAPGEARALPPLPALLAVDEGAGGGGDGGYGSVHIVCTLVTARARTGGSDALPAHAPELRAEVVGTAVVDWRAACGEEGGALNVLVPLLPTERGPSLLPAGGGGAGSGGAPPGATAAAAEAVPVGLLPLSLTLLPAKEGGGDGDAPRAEVARALGRAASKRADAAKAFLLYARAWWADYRGLHPTFRHRLVRVFGESGEAGGRFVPTASRVAALPADRVGCDSPAAAARFVSLLPHWRADPAGAVGPATPGAPAWRSLHAILAAKGGSAQDHALLLASLFLGFGLDAYVVVGTRAVAGEEGGGGGGGSGGGAGGDPALGPREEEHAWVLTRAPKKGGGFRAVFHEPLTAQRFSPTSPACPYLRVACAFSADRFYALQAGDDSVAYVDGSVGWAFEDPLGAGWKGMEPSLLAALPHAPPPPLAPPSLDAAALGAALEGALRAELAAHRAAPPAAARLAASRATLALMAGRPELDGTGGAALPACATPWSDRLSFLLGQALAAYEDVRPSQNSPLPPPPPPRSPHALYALLPPFPPAGSPARAGHGRGRRRRRPHHAAGGLFRGHKAPGAARLLFPGVPHCLQPRVALACLVRAPRLARRAGNHRRACSSNARALHVFERFFTTPTPTLPPTGARARGPRPHRVRAASAGHRVPRGHHGGVGHGCVHQRSASRGGADHPPPMKDAKKNRITPSTWKTSWRASSPPSSPRAWPPWPPWPPWAPGRGWVCGRVRETERRRAKAPACCAPPRTFAAFAGLAAGSSISSSISSGTSSSTWPGFSFSSVTSSVTICLCSASVGPAAAFFALDAGAFFALEAVGREKGGNYG